MIFVIIKNLKKIYTIVDKAWENTASSSS